MQIFEVVSILGVILWYDQDSFRRPGSEVECEFADFLTENARSATQIDLADIVETGGKEIAIHRCDLVSCIAEIHRAIKHRRCGPEPGLEPGRNLMSFFENGVSDLIF